jgi:membrane-bound serine protease (ClpP class)
MVLMIALLVIGLLMVCLEIFIPGGIVGTLGGIALIASIILGFTNKGTEFGMYWLMGVLVLTLLGIFLSIKFLPRSPAGKRLFLRADESGYKSTEEGLADLLGQEGIALTYLRPSGMVEINGKRLDVVTGGEFLPRGTKVEVIEIEGNRVVVKAKETKTNNQTGLTG